MDLFEKLRNELRKTSQPLPVGIDNETEKYQYEPKPFSEYNNEYDKEFVKSVITEISVKEVNGNSLLLKFLNKNKKYVDLLNEYKKCEKIGRPSIDDNVSFVYSLIEKTYMELGLIDEIEERKTNIKLSLRKYFFLENEDLAQYEDFYLNSVNPFKGNRWIDMLSAINREIKFLGEDCPEVAVLKYKKVLSYFNNSKTISFYPRLIEDIVAFYTIYHGKTVDTYEKIYEELYLTLKSTAKTSKKIKEKVSETPDVWHDVVKYMDEEEEDFINSIKSLIVNSSENFLVKRYKSIINNCVDKFDCLTECEKSEIKKIIFENGENEPYLNKNKKKVILNKVLKDGNQESCNFLDVIINTPRRMDKGEAVVRFLRGVLSLDLYQRLKSQTKTSQELYDKINKTLQEVGVATFSYNKKYYLKNHLFDYSFSRLIEKEMDGEIKADEDLVLWQ